MGQGQAGKACCTEAPDLQAVDELIGPGPGGRPLGVSERGPSWTRPANIAGAASAEGVEGVVAVAKNNHVRA